MPIRTGTEATLQYKTGGVAATGSWQALTNVRDLTASFTAAEADISTRANSGWRATRAGLKEGTLEFEMLWDVDDDGFTAIQSAFISNNQIIGMRVLDANNGEGLTADMVVTGFSISQPLEEAQTVSVTMKITYAGTAPVIGPVT